MAFRIESPRGAAASLDPAVVAAIGAALEFALASDSGDVAAALATSPWRAAGRSVEAFDAYEAARFAHVARRGRA